MTSTHGNHDIRRVGVVGGGLMGSGIAEVCTRAFVSGTLGKQVILATDRAGFVVNALLIPCLLAAVRMVGAGLLGRKTGRGFHTLPYHED